MRKLIGVLGLSTAALLAGCGGGGGSPGDTPESYSITLVAAKTSLPLNIAGYPAGIGVNAPFTTTLYVNAKKGDAPIPGGEDIFACNTEYGLDSGPLYYLDGDSEHEDDDGNPLAYRNITLGANAGGNSFHFHAGDQAGVATITCSVHDPRANREVSASVNITVGGGAGSGKAASIQGIAKYPNLGVQGNLTNLRTSTAISAYVWDDANQPVASSGRANLQVSIVRAAGDAAQGARLLADGKQGSSVLQVKTTGGVGLFSLASGSQEGPILLEMVTDRLDNDVTNGLQDPITGYLVVLAMEEVPSNVVPDPIEFVDIAPASATNGVPYSYVLSAKGGVPPYTWTALGRLPDGLSLSPSGLISGTPNMATPGAVQVAVRVTDSQGVSQTANLTITVAAAPEPPPAPEPTPTPPAALSINLSGCGSNVNVPCALPDATSGASYAYILSASGGDTSKPVVWTYTSLPGWLAGGAASGAMTGTAPVVGVCTTDNFVVTAVRDAATVSRAVSLQVCP